MRDAQALAAAQTLDGAGYRKLSESGRDVAFELYAQGHYQLRLQEDDE